MRIQQTLLICILIWVYLPVFSWLGWAWGHDEFYAHGPLLLMIIAFLLWRDRAKITQASKIPLKSDGAAWAILLLGLGIEALGLIGGVICLQAISLPILTLGIVRLVMGPCMERLIRFPILYSLMVVPPKTILIEELTYPMQLIASRGAGVWLGLLGIPVEIGGVNIHTSHYDLAVVAGCSGIKNVVILFALAVLLARFLPGLSNQERCLLCLASIPIATLINILRITCITIIGCQFGPGAAEGALHGLSGIVMFVVGLTVLTEVGLFVGRKRVVREGAAS